MADIVFSYKKQDRERIELLVQSLKGLGFSVWWDYDIETGQDWFESILEHIDAARCVVGVWSRSSVTRDGRFIPNERGMQYVRTEHMRATPSKLAPVLLDRDCVPAEFSQIEAADLSDWDGTTVHQGLQNLVERIETLAAPEWLAARLNQFRSDLENESRIRRAAQSRLAAVNAKAESDALIYASSAAQVESLTLQLAEARQQVTELTRQLRVPGEGPTFTAAAVSPISSPSKRGGWSTRLWSRLPSKAVICMTLVAGFVNALIVKVALTAGPHQVFSGPQIIQLSLMIAAGPALVVGIRSAARTSNGYALIAIILSAIVIVGGMAALVTLVLLLLFLIDVSVTVPLTGWTVALGAVFGALAGFALGKREIDFALQ